MVLAIFTQPTNSFVNLKFLLYFLFHMVTKELHKRLVYIKFRENSIICYS